jgi:hypothetical protein
MWKTALPLVGGILVTLPTASFSAEIVRLVDPDKYELQVVGLSIERRGTVKIEAVGLRPPWNDQMTVTAWLLDGETREPVWAMKRRDTKRVKGSRLLRRVEADVTVDPGKYELYFYSGSNGDNFVINVSGFSDIWNWRRGERDWEDDLDECFVSVSSDDLSASDVTRFEVTGGHDDALIRFTKLGDSRSETQGFEITSPTKLRIYCLTEHPRGSDSPADYGWIVNAETHDVVWRPSKRDTKPAGGGDKNRLFNEDVAFEPGRYILRYGTDDSHSYEEFNAVPPYDPVNWGITVLPGAGFGSSDFRPFEANRPEDAIITLAQVGNSEFKEQAFRLSKPGSVHLVAIGEYDTGGREFADYAWISRVGSSEPVWEMTRQNTMPGGGDEKNRLFDGEVRLDAGDYELFYTTDDSHAFDDWNAGAPIDPEGWGVTLYATSSIGKGDVKLISRAEERESGDIVVKITRVGDDERRRERFSLSQATDLQIHALGEGVGGDMVDYAYIIDDETGRTAWEMEYRDTRHAGGARKNRVFDGVVHLRAGKYELVYESDGSHSFDGWNERRPRDPMNWGVTITRAR